LRLFALVLIAFFASFLSFRGQKFVVSEFLFLASGLIGGLYIKGLEPGTYRFFELFLIGFFGIIYGMSLDLSMILKSAQKSLKLAFMEAFLGIVYLIVVSLVLHPHGITLTEKLAILAFVIVGASPYFIVSLAREEIIASFFLPAIVALALGLAGFHRSSLIMFGAVLVTGIILKVTEDRAPDTTTALSIVMGGSIIIPYIAIHYDQSPFFYSFIMGILLTNLLRSKRLLELLLKLKEDERLFFLVFLFMIGLFTNVNTEVIKKSLIIFALRVFYKIAISRGLYNSKDDHHFVSCGALSLIIAIDVLGHGEILRGWGAAIVIAYFINIVFTGIFTLKAQPK